MFVPNVFLKNLPLSHGRNVKGARLNIPQIMTLLSRKLSRKEFTKKIKQDSQLSSAALLNSSVSSVEITEQQDCSVKRLCTRPPRATVITSRPGIWKVHQKKTAITVMTPKH